MPDYYDEMGDAVFRAQFRILETAFRSADLDVRVEPYVERDVHYQYVPGRVQMRNATPEDADRVLRAAGVLPGARVVGRDDGRRVPENIALVLFDDGELGVPAALDRLDGALGPGFATPDHVLSITGGVSNCPGTEPDPVPSPGYGPHPRVAADPGLGQGVRIGVPDSGFVAGTGHAWLAGGVAGEPDPNVDTTTAPPTLHAYAGHGTFIAGVARCAAPAAEIWVSNHYRHAGANVETEVFADLIDMINGRVQTGVDAQGRPVITDVGPFDVVSLSAGGHTRNNVPNLSGPEVAAALAANERTLLLAAAGNNASPREFYPAALREVTGVGALGFDRAGPAWFSNVGPWVDVWALGEGLINAYPVGHYTYNEPPRNGYRMLFPDLARWSGTSFATPLVAGLVAARMTTAGVDSRTALAQLVAAAGPGAVLG
ncbi:S8 family peptidase [Pseudonocardia hydrocarbonoxydans]|uniref:Peptidase S8/S53 domain-containing protein n=1 Tax=Pseudonocardia hydrocarbonoxydans TaxID=76726 RepID=A0A4Y3WIZ5_9PSEU|nr:S8/S53 family peptidase [Pseudonocardia hydrocarbonoxydans]GEC18715.1 hypothetical protein PHY01_09980 [Pseudonocardia hydrocarbonoxydans]